MERFVTTGDRARRKARRLKDNLAGYGSEHGLGRCQEMISRMYGFRSTNDLLGSQHLPHGNFDEDIDQALVKARLSRHVKILVDEIGLNEADAVAVIEIVGPTRAKWTLD
jgi:hypothetical protein